MQPVGVLPQNDGAWAGLSGLLGSFAEAVLRNSMPAKTRSCFAARLEPTVALFQNGHVSGFFTGSCSLSEGGAE